MTPEDAARRDRLVAAGGVLAAAALAWAYVAHMALMDPGAGAALAGLPRTAAWGLADTALAFAMWAVMMAAMMLPSAAPMVAAFAAIDRARRAAGGPAWATAAFAAAYLLVWTVFSAAATGLQWALQAAALLSPATLRVTPAAGGVLLVAAGLYQWSPAKTACLAHCRAPLGFLLGHWRAGARGAFAMGVRHGLYCLGCCWLLMALLFAAGVMNLLWIALLAALVLAEKVAPRGRALGRAAGVALAAWGCWLLAAGG
jgi:predicted metal-binding membrane protein